MPKPIIDGANFKTQHGGCRPPKDDESKHLTPIPQHVVDALKAKQAAKNNVKGSWLSLYKSQFQLEGQGGTGCCTACAADVLMMAGCLFLQNVKMPQLSWGFGYYTCTNDATFRNGWSVSGAVQSRAIGKGCCKDDLYSAAYVLSQFQGGNVFNASQLPQPPAYTDGALRKVLQWHSVPKDWETIKALLIGGHPIALGVGNHAFTLIEYAGDDWLCLGLDSEMNATDGGYGLGVRGITRDTLINNAYDLVTVTLIQPGPLDAVVVTSPPPPPPPLSGNAMLRDQAIAGWTALDPANFTQQQKDQLVSYAQQLTPTAVSVTNSATFLQADTTTQGNWKGVYGANGYNVIGDAASYPAYAKVTPSANQSYTWASAPTEAQALQRAGAGRIAACWYSSGLVGGSFNVDINLTDGAAHRVAVYLLDWDNNGRVNRVDVLDAATQQVLSTQTVQAFQAGKYLVWNLQGHVILRFTSTAGSNAVASGILFG